MRCRSPDSDLPRAPPTGSARSEPARPRAPDAPVASPPPGPPARPTSTRASHADRPSSASPAPLRARAPVPATAHSRPAAPRWSPGPSHAPRATPPPRPPTARSPPATPRSPPDPAPARPPAPPAAPAAGRPDGSGPRDCACQGLAPPESTEPFSMYPTCQDHRSITPSDPPECELLRPQTRSSVATWPTLRCEGLKTDSGLNIAGGRNQALSGPLRPFCAPSPPGENRASSVGPPSMSPGREGSGRCGTRCRRAI